VHRQGRITDRTFENQSYRASGLNLAVAAIVYWTRSVWPRPNSRVTSRHKDHLIGNRFIADIQKQLAIETGEPPERFFPGLKREILPRRRGDERDAPAVG
jgi:hypothetical protein